MTATDPGLIADAPTARAHHEQAHTAFLDRARTTARLLGQHGATATADDVRDRCPVPPGVNPNVMGAVFSPGEWERVGYTASRRRMAHNRLLRVFRLRVATQ